MTTKGEPMLNTTDDSMKAAREWARYHIGDASWANDIIWAFEHPEEAYGLLNEGD